MTTEAAPRTYSGKMSNLISIDGIGTEVVHYYGTATGWLYRATCGDDDYTVETVNSLAIYTGTVGTAPTLADSIRLMEAHQRLFGTQAAPQHPTYRTHKDGRRP